LRERLFTFPSLLLATGLGSILLLLFGIPSLAQADTVNLKDQPKPLYGKILSVSDELIILEAENGSRIPVARKSVSSIEFTGAPQVTAPVPDKAVASFNSNQAIPAPPKLPQSNESKGINALMYSPIVPLLSFPNEKGEINEKLFITLSKFKGHKSQKQYAGLYNFTNKGTFWVRLPQVQQKSADLQFTLFGKQGILDKQTQLPENYAVQARFLTDGGELIEESPVASFSGNQAEMVEWLYLLEGMSGISGKSEVSWRVPEKTKTIEFRVISSGDNNRHLVGYLGQLTLVSPE
jgi:hypothetical protein